MRGGVVSVRFPPSQSRQRNLPIRRRRSVLTLVPVDEDAAIYRLVRDKIISCAPGATDMVERRNCEQRSRPAQARAGIHQTSRA